jgi:NAD(P)H-flavin reductase
MANAAKLKANVESIAKHGEGTYEVRFLPEGRVPRFKAGQFLHLTVDEYDPEGGFWPESRVFSIASRSGAELITIVYSVKGRYTKLMEERLAPGREVWIKLPFGDFTIESRVKEGSDVVLVAGGTGISPFVPYLEGLAEGDGAGRRVRLYYGLRSPDQLIFGETLGRCRKGEKLDLRVWLESNSSELGGFSGLEMRHGRLDPDILFKESEDLATPDFFLSGPPAMIRSFKAALLGKGLGVDKIQIDEWE